MMPEATTAVDRSYLRLLETETASIRPGLSASLVAGMPDGQPRERNPATGSRASGFGAAAYNRLAMREIRPTNGAAGTTTILDCG
jgi:hypothetical protein